MTQWFVLKNMLGFLPVDPIIIEAEDSHEALAFVTDLTGLTDMDSIVEHGFYMLSYDKLIDAAVYNEDADIVTERSEAELQFLIGGEGY